MDDLEQHLRNSMSQLDEAIRDLHHRAPAMPSQQQSAATINVNAGGVGVWFCSAICLALLIGFFVAGFWVSSEFARINARFTEQADTDSVQDAYIHKLRAEQAAQPEH